MSNVVDETLKLVSDARKESNDTLAKNFTQSSTATQGIQGYDLSAPSKKLFPILTPLRNKIARVGAGYGSQANWKAITGIHSRRFRAGVTEGLRGAAHAHATAEYFAAYRTIGGEKSVTFEADNAANGFEDLKSLAALNALRSLMVDEELMILGGNTSNALGTTPTPSLAASASGGSLATGTLSVICVALGLQAYWDVAGANNGATGQTGDLVTGVLGVISRTTADGTSENINDGSAQKSAAQTVSVTGPTGSVAATVTAVQGAYGYAWYWGAAGSERLGAVTTINSVSITANAGGSNQLASALAAADHSQNSREFDGLLSIANKSGSGSYYRALATGTAGTGTSLSEGSGRIVEIDTALAEFYSLYRIQPNEILLSFKQFQKITNLILGSSNPNVQISVNPNDDFNIVAGKNVGRYQSPITGEMIALTVHPNMPPGTMLFMTWNTPNYIDGVLNMVQIKTRQDYYQIDWPLKTRKYEYGVYSDQVLQHFFPPAMGIISNIAD